MQPLWQSTELPYGYSNTLKCATLTAKKPCATELVAIASAKTEAARVARQRQQRAKKQTPKRTEPVPDGYKTFFFQRDDPDPPYFPLRLSLKGEGGY